MAKSWEEDLWLIISIFSSVLGLHLIFRKLLYFSSVVPILPIFATVTTDLFYRVLLFSPSYRHESYFTPLSKRILESACMEIIVVSISETMFCCMEYKSVARFSLLAYGIASLWARFRRPCDIPQTAAYGYYKVFWSIGIIIVLLSAWHGSDAYTNHFFVGTLLFSRSSESFIYHLYLEADRHMGNAEYCEWLMRQIGRGAIVRTPMLADLFWTRDLYVPEYRYSV